MKILGALIALYAATGAYAAPVIQGIVNAATYGFPAPSKYAIAQGSMFIVFGTELGPVALQQSTGASLGRSLAGTSIRVTVDSTTVDAILVYTSATQVAGILPSNTPLGIGYLAVTYNGSTSQSGAFRVVRSAPGILAQNQAGTGPALAQNFNSATDQPRNSFTRSARPGQVVTLWGTGLGPAPGNETVAPVSQDLNVNLELLVGGKPASVRYKGRSGCCAGVDQIIFEVPRDVVGCHVPVVVRAGDLISNFTTISIASSGDVCTDLSGASGSELEKVQTSGDLRSGLITLSLNRDEETFGVPGYNEYASGQFVQSAGLLLTAVPRGMPSPGSCVLSPQVSPQLRPEFVPEPSRLLDAGPVLNVNGPKGARQVPRRDIGSYQEQLSQNARDIQYLQPGTYTVNNGAGGSDVGPFQATLTIPPAFVANIEQTSGSTTVTWTGGDPAGYTVIRGFAGSVLAGTGAEFVCTERVSVRQFAIPAVVLSSVPASRQGVSPWSISVHSPVQTNFRATGLDVGHLAFLP